MILHFITEGRFSCYNKRAIPLLQDTIESVVPTEKEQAQAVHEEAMPVANTTHVVYPSEFHQQKHSESRLTAKVYLSSNMSRTGSFHQGASDISMPINDHEQQNVHHRQPIRFGLSLRYQLDNRWSVESGLSYTRLSSDITTMTDGKTTTTEQRLNYIGLPLNISYDLWRTRHFGLYLIAGGMIEKSLDTSPWQFSLNGAAGAEYKLTDYFSLYAEPGLGYYFKDGSTTPTVYQDHPLNFNLSFGLRFHFK